MQRHFNTTAVVLLCAGLVPSSVPADAPPDLSSQRIEAQTGYAHTALDLYGTGYALIERATRLDHDALAATDERAHRRARSDAADAYEEALQNFQEAVRLEPRMYEAHTYVGYANRKLGRYDEALSAYEAALQLKPDYARAIEYQAEAYLGLDRFEHAKFNYLRLYALDARQAQKLLSAMHRWLGDREREPREVPREQITSASKWLASRPATAIEKSAAAETPW